MLSFLLDEHVSPQVALRLRERHFSITAYALQDWQQGRYLSTRDDFILDAASQHSLTLVTYDVSTIPNWIKKRSQKDLSHSGVIFVAGRTIKSSDIGGLVRALSYLWTQRKKEDWTNRVEFLGKE